MDESLVSATSFTGYWLYAAGFAGSFYYVCVAFGERHSTPEIKKQLSRILVGELEDTWAGHFRNLFDRVFGKKHLSLMCFTRSSVISILAVLLIYLFFSKIVGVLDRAPEGITLLKAIVLGTLINIVPDYISLLETRWLLKHIDRFKSFWSQILVLLVDVVITGVIIWIPINVIKYFLDGTQVSIVEMLAVFSIYSVFFYSTFVTSVWTWLYFISCWVLKGFKKFAPKLRHPIDENPEAQIGAIGALIVFLIAFVAKPVFEAPDQYLPTPFDKKLCELFPRDACSHIARLTYDEKTFWLYVEKSCKGGRLDDCAELASYMLDGDEKKSLELAERACKGGINYGCGILGFIYEKGEIVSKDLSKAFELYSRGCEEYDSYSCYNIGRMYEFGFAVDRDISKAISFYEQACEGGLLYACSRCLSR